METDHFEIDLSEQSVGYRTCIICGKTFAKDLQHPKRRKCPECFSTNDGKCRPEVARTAALFAAMKSCEEIDEKKRLERIRKRDEAYAEWERENGVTVRVIETDTVRTEIRGQVCAGCRTAKSVYSN